MPISSAGLSSPAWKPNRWIAGLLGLVVQPLGLLYVVQPKWAVFYLSAGVLISIAEFTLLFGAHLPRFGWLSVPWLLSSVCAIHAIRFADKFEHRRRRPWYSKTYGLATMVATLLVSIFLIRAFLVEPFNMAGKSMLPTIEPGSVLLVQKAGYGHYGTFGIQVLRTEITTPIERGDIVVFEYPKQPTVHYAKRVVGLPGDVIEYTQDALLVNRQPLAITRQPTRDSDLLLAQTLRPAPGIAIGSAANRSTITVSEGTYFVLGDNRRDSNDSRHWGLLTQRNVVGRVVYILQPPTKISW